MMWLGQLLHYNWANNAIFKILTTKQKKVISCELKKFGEQAISDSDLTEYVTLSESEKKQHKQNSKWKQ